MATYWPEVQALQAVHANALEVVEYWTPVGQAWHTVLVEAVQLEPMKFPAVQVVQAALAETPARQ